jgi:hypothetical protein
LDTFTDVAEEPDAPILSVDGNIQFVTPVNFYDTTRRHITEHTTHSMSPSVIYASTEITMAVETVIAALRGVTPCNLVDKCEHFGLTHFLFIKKL